MKSAVRSVFSYELPLMLRGRVLPWNVEARRSEYVGWIEVLLLRGEIDMWRSGWKGQGQFDGICTT